MPNPDPYPLQGFARARWPQDNMSKGSSEHKTVDCRDIKTNQKWFYFEGQTVNYY